MEADIFHNFFTTIKSTSFLNELAENQKRGRNILQFQSLNEILSISFLHCG